MALREPSTWKDVGRYGSVGLELVLSVLIGFFGGRWIDEKVDAGGWVTVVGVVFGTYAGFRALYKTAKSMERRAEKETKDRPWEVPRTDPTLLDEVAPETKPDQRGGSDEREDEDREHRDRGKDPEKR